MLSGGSTAQADGDELQELITVPLFEGPMVVSDLQDHGIEATALDSFNLATQVVSDVRILVARRDFDAAQTVLAARSLDESE